MPRRVYAAVLIAFLLHGLFIITARYRLSYDAYTHMLFANHYAEDWFSLWEPRWYTGFTVVSYPPLAHQLIALFIPLLGFDKAFALMLWVVGTCYPLGIYAFVRIFTGRSAASYAALISAILLPIYVTAYIFGQLPFLASTLVALLVAASLNQYLQHGDLHSLLLSVSLIATLMATHHATLIVQPFFVLAVAINNLVLLHRTQSNAFLLMIKRLIVFGLLSIMMALLVIWPFWQWGMDQTIQTPIDHLSRHNFFRDPRAFAVFFFPLYGPLVCLIPFLVRKWSPRFVGLLISFVILLLLGLGGTTPLPRLIFGESWEWLTFDRFAFWASLTLTPFFGILFIRFRYGWKTRVVTKPVVVTLRRNFVSAATLSVFALSALGAWFSPIFFPTQPQKIDMDPIVDYLNQDNRSQWRYVTFGFGNQYTYLNLLTTATTIDGSYHTARALPELRESGIAEVDTVYWASLGIPAIAPILRKSGAHGVRWGFVNPEILQDYPLRPEAIRGREFAALLEQLGWIKREVLENGVLVYENPQAILPLPSTPPKENPFTSFSWGTFPLLALAVSLSLGTLKVRPVEASRIISSLYFVLIGLIPITICFWYFRSVLEFAHPRVYFIYTDVLFFMADALMVLVAILWASTRISQGAYAGYDRSNLWLSAISYGLIGIVVLMSLSAIWSYDWRISLFLSLHFWLVLLLIFSLRDWHAAWKTVMIGLCAALSIELVIGFLGFGLQSTAFLKPLEMEWPGALDAQLRGASVVQLTEGLRVLRAYGTVPHPNILGGLALLTLLGPASIFLLSKTTNHPALILMSLGVVLIVLTFSRSAWLGLLAFLSILVLKSHQLDRRRLYLLISASLLTIALTAYPLRDLIFTRVSNAPVPTEQLSTFGREWLNQQALSMFYAHPFSGVGIGSFILKLSSYAVEGALIEPAHGIPLLVAAELGALGVLLLGAIALAAALGSMKAKTPKSVLASAMIVGLAVIGLFDHYLWTLAPGRIMLGLALGLWLGQIQHDA